MRRITLLLITAIFTFVIGVISSVVWIRSNHSPATVQVNDASNVVTSTQSQEIDLQWVYINQDLKWELPPKSITRESGIYKYSVNERILVFYPNGRFASIGCTIYQVDKAKKMMLIPNEGYAVHKGTWKRNNDGTITITSRLISSNKLATDFNGKLHEERVEQLIIRKVADDRLAEELGLSGKIFISSPSIEGIGELLSLPDGDI
jgi:hypothetical protein